VTQSESNQTRRVVRFHGRVQGVGFRATCESLASRHPGITGTVRNENDGTVLLNAQGPPPAVNAFLDDIETSMRHHIEHADSTPAHPDPDLNTFTIIR